MGVGGDTRVRAYGVNMISPASTSSQHMLKRYGVEKGATSGLKIWAERLKGAGLDVMRETDRPAFVTVTSISTQGTASGPR